MPVPTGVKTLTLGGNESSDNVPYLSTLHAERRFVYTRFYVFLLDRHRSRFLGVA